MCILYVDHFPVQFIILTSVGASPEMWCHSVHYELLKVFILLLDSEKRETAQVCEHAKKKKKKETVKYSFSHFVL